MGLIVSDTADYKLDGPLRHNWSGSVSYLFVTCCEGSVVGTQAPWLSFVFPILLGKMRCLESPKAPVLGDATDELVHIMSFYTIAAPFHHRQRIL
jgi:hypothetical protein